MRLKSNGGRLRKLSIIVCPPSTTVELGSSGFASLFPDYLQPAAAFGVTFFLRAKEKHSLSFDFNLVPSRNPNTGKLRRKYTKELGMMEM